MPSGPPPKVDVGDQDEGDVKYKSQKARRLNEFGWSWADHGPDRNYYWRDP